MSLGQAMDVFMGYLQVCVSLGNSGFDLYKRYPKVRPNSPEHDRLIREVVQFFADNEDLMLVLYRLEKLSVAVFLYCRLRDIAVTKDDLSNSYVDAEVRESLKYVVAYALSQGPITLTEEKDP